jgi:hypothetical protein
MDPSYDLLDRAAHLLGVHPKTLVPFDERDPLHDGLRLEGFLCRRPDHRYGALALLSVDGRATEQVILATPKLHYPFGKTGEFHFPAVREIRIYDKIDGTNVLSYRYRDADGALRTSYKLRLCPVLRDSKWGDFLGMWRDLLAQHPEIPALAARNDCAISFEMFGARNAHLIEYDEPLSCVVLFGVRQDGSVVAPCDLETGAVPRAPLLATLRGDADPVGEYGAFRARMEAGNAPAEDGRIRGTEGCVWYVRDGEGDLHLFKCKPESVEAIHWAVGINKTAVIATVWNLLETSDELTYDALLPLLQEEYDDDAIEAFRAHIDDALERVRAEVAFRARVVELCAATGLSFADDRGACMRALSQHFAAREMRHVFHVLKAVNG